jgi:glycosyltransferase involved in cell wall biosynthesis
VSGRVVALDMTLARLGRAGPHVYMTRLAEALTPRLGERLCCISSGLAAPLGAQRSVGDRLRTLGRDVWWHQLGVSAAARRAGAEILHLPAGLGPVRPRMPSVITIHDLIALRLPQYFPAWARSYARAVLPWAARAARAVIAVSEATKRDVVELLDVPEERVTVVLNGVSATFAPIGQDGARAKAVRARFALPRDFVLAVGTLEPRKNLPRVLEAVHRLRSRPATRDIQVVHAGPHGWLADDIARTVRALDLADAVRFIGYVPPEDLAPLYGLARLCVYPSLYEGFGFPVAEAMACGCPVVTSNVSSLPEVAGDAAVLVDPTSVEAIADAVGTLWSDEARRRALAHRGLARAPAFSWERTADATVRVYDTAAS